MAPSRRRPSGFTQGFTLIELLVVIAIIAILTAILLPVFASVREGSRQGVSISNMKDIQQKMEQYKLDNHKYPDVLFGYAITGGANVGYTDSTTTLTNALSKAQAFDAAHPGSNQAQIAFPGLYPAYIKDPNEFTDPNNTVDPNATPQTTSALSVNLVAPCFASTDMTLSGAGSSPCSSPTAAGQVVTTKRTFYKLDAYDSGPQVTGGNQVDPATFLPRYQLAHEGTVCPTGVSPAPTYCDSTVSTTDPDYKRQLRWQNPPADTVITLTSYHVQNADKVLLMFQSGAVKKLKAEDFVPKEGTANFWRYPQQ